MTLPQNIYDDPVFFAGYEQLRTSGSGLNEVLEQPALWAMLPESLSGMRIVDLGCGFGDCARKMRKAGAERVVAIDCSQKMLEKARSLTSDPMIEYRRMNLEDLEIDEDAFDLAVSSLALHYVSDYQSVVQRIAGLLRKGGRFVFSVEHPLCTALPAQQWIHNQNGDPMFWPVDEYRSEGPRNTRWFVDGVIKYHRTIETWVNGLLQTGFRLLELREPAPVLQSSTRHPLLDLHRRRPPFLLLSAER